MTSSYTPIEARIDPASAASRVEHFRNRLMVAEETKRLAEMAGEKVHNLQWAYERILRAQLTFAEWQVEDLAKEAGATAKVAETQPSARDANLDILIRELREIDPENPRLRFVEEALRDA